MNKYICPVCGYKELESPPRKFSICPSCGTEFGYDDAIKNHENLRKAWILGGLEWWDKDMPVPANWDPYHQLLSITNEIIYSGSNLDKEISQGGHFVSIDFDVQMRFSNPVIRADAGSTSKYSYAIAYA